MPRLNCLYCENREGRRTLEHVLQGGFGANLTLSDEVCEQCNTGRFSPLDDRLVKFVRINLCWDHPDIRPERTLLQEDLGLTFDSPSRNWLSVRIERTFQLVIPPQIIFLGNNQIRFVCDNNVSGMLDRIRDELREPQTLSITPDVRGGYAPPLQPSLVRTGRRKYLVRGPDEAAVADVRWAVLSGQFLADWQQTGSAEGQIINPGIQFQARFHYGAIARGIAKTAVNFVCKALGSAAARQPEFDAVRQFVLSPDGSGYERFVQFLFGDGGIDAPLQALVDKVTRTGHHTLLLYVCDGLPLVLVLLYQRPFAVIRLTEQPHPEIFHGPTAVAGLFDYRSRTHRVLSLRERPSEFADLLGPEFRE